MLREDYNKFLNVCKKNLDEKFFLQNYETDNNFFHSFTRIRRNNTLALQEQYKEIEMHHGIFIDVFPLDNIEKDTISAKIQYELVLFIRKLKEIKLLRNNSLANQTLKRTSKKNISLITKIIPMKLLNKLETYFATLFNKRNTTFSSLLVETINLNYDRCMIKNSEFKDIIELEFEVKCFIGPKNYDEKLKKHFGDYMKLPPIEDRKGHHRIIKLKFYD